MLQNTTRPYFRASTGELAALVDAGQDLPGIAAELAHRNRGAARALAARVADMLRSGASVVALRDADTDQPVAVQIERGAPFRREVVPLPDHIEVGAQERARIRDAFQAWRERDAAERAEWEARQTEAQRLVLQAWASQDMPERIAAYTHRRWQGRADRPVAQKFSSDFRDRVFRRFSKMIRRQHGIAPEPMPV